MQEQVVLRLFRCLKVFVHWRYLLVTKLTTQRASPLHRTRRGLTLRHVALDDLGEKRYLGAYVHFLCRRSPRVHRVTVLYVFCNSRQKRCISVFSKIRRHLHIVICRASSGVFRRQRNTETFFSTALHMLQRKNQSQLGSYWFRFGIRCAVGRGTTANLVGWTGGVPARARIVRGSRSEAKTNGT